MNFSEFLQISEIVFDAAQQVQFVGDKHQGFEAKFTINNEEFQVNFVSKPLKLVQETLFLWDISFYGPNGANLTKQNRYMQEIYSKLLSVIVSFNKQFKPDGFYFYGARNAMDIIYNRMYKKFFQDAPGKDPQEVFYQITSSAYLTKAKFETFDPVTQNLIRQIIQQTAADYSNKINNFRDEKKDANRGLAYVKERLGGIYHYNADYSNHGGLIVEVVPHFFTVLYLNNYNKIIKDKYSTPSIYTDGSTNLKYSNFYHYNESGKTPELMSDILKMLFSPDLNSARFPYSDLLKNIPQPAMNYYQSLYFKMFQNKAEL